MWNTNRTAPKKILVSHWEQRLYEYFIQRPSLRKFQRTFGGLLANRKTVLSHSLSQPQNFYMGNFFARFESDEYCEIEIFLSFDKKGGDFPIEATEFGYVYFGEVQSKEKNCSTPSLHLLVKDDGDIAKKFDQLFSEVKSCGGSGVEVFFDINVEPILELDAKAVWGGHEEDNNNLPGRQNFPFCSIEFEARI